MLALKSAPHPANSPRWIETAKLSVVSHFAHSKVRTSKPGEVGSMQANLMGLPHFKHAPKCQFLHG